jgi:malonate transporter and related proteins
VNSPVVSALLPVVFLIAIGFIAVKAGLVRVEANKDLSDLVFSVLTPALLFRTMSTVHVEQLNFKPLGMYFAAVLLLFMSVFVGKGRTHRAAVLALACTFSNTVMIGIPLITLAYGQAGVVTLLTLVSVHLLVMLTITTVVLELVSARQARLAGQGGQQHMALTVLLALKGGIIHPVPMPIILGLLFAQTGLVLPEVVDRPLQLLGSAFGPVALVLVGAMLTQVQIGTHLKAALGISLLKNLALPLLVALMGLGLGMAGPTLNVMIVTAALPMGANVFLFAQRYEVAQELVTASLAVSTLLGLLTITLVMALVGWLG